jgi:predicted nucleotidyltransferase
MRTPEHTSFVEKVISVLKEDERILGIALGGSWARNEMDKYSDLDFSIVVRPEHIGPVLNERIEIAGKVGALINAFTGEHVGDNRIIICMFDQPLLHVDLKFVSLSEFHVRSEDPEVMWERDGALSNVFTRSSPSFPEHSLQWMEDRFWTWIHYCSVKLGRGELFELVSSINFLRDVVIGPLLQKKYGKRPMSVRRLEFIVSPEEQSQLEKTACSYSRQSCFTALEAEIALYRELRNFHNMPQFEPRDKMEEIAIRYFYDIAKEKNLLSS